MPGELSIPRECRLLLNAAAWLVPKAQRAGWKRERAGEIWYGRQSGRGRAALLSICGRAWADAARQRYRSEGLIAIRLHPGFCLGVLGAALLVAAAASHGLRTTRLLLGGLPYPQPQTVAVVSQRGVFMGQRVGVRTMDWHAWQKAEPHSFTSLAAYRFGPREARVSSGFFAVVRLVPAFNEPGSAVLSHGFWRRRYGANPGVIGSRLEWEGRPFRIRGVLPPRFWFLRRDIDVWLVLPDAEFSGLIGIVGRLRPGVRAPDAAAELQRLEVRWTWRPAGLSFEVTPLASRLREPLGRYPATAVLFFLLALVLAWRGLDWFYAAKVALLVLLLLVGALEFSGAASVTETGGSSFWAEPFSFWGFLVAGIGAVWWALADQRLRCPQCHRRLIAPARIGESGRSFLEPAGTELICIREHGALYMPEPHSAEGEQARWSRLG